MLTALAAVAALAAGVSAAAPDPASSAQGVTERVFGSAVADQFAFSVIPADPATGHDAFEVDYDSSSSKVIVRGNT